MGAIEDHLRDWRAAGLIDAEAEQRILAHERTRQLPVQERPTVLEGLIYVGLAIIAVGVALLIASNWDNLPDWAKVLIPGAPALAGIAAGFVLRDSALPSMRRGAAVTWLVASALLATTAAVVGAIADWPAESVLFAAAITGTAVAVALWTAFPTNPQLIGMAAGMLLLSIWLGVEADTHGVATGSLAAAVVGVAAIALVEAGILRPVALARLLAALFTAGGAYLAGLDSGDAGWMELLVFVAALALVALSVQRAGFAYMVIGVLALFVGLTSSIGRHVDDPTIAALAFIVVGVGVIGAVMLLVKRRPWALTPAT